MEQMIMSFQDMSEGPKRLNLRTLQAKYRVRQKEVPYLGS
jgi:hypothetical protein